MNATKKLLALLLALVMVFALATTAFATDLENPGEGEEPAPAPEKPNSFTISIVADEGSGLTTGHEYKVYQIFVGDLAKDEDGKDTLVNIKYGSAGVGTAGEAVPNTVLEGITDAAEYAKSLDIDNLTVYDKLTKTNNWTLSDVPAGYYLIVDDTTQNIAEGDAYSSYIVKVVQNVEMAPKSDKTYSDKEEYNDDVVLTDVNEAGVGAVVSYKLTGHIADNAKLYDYYYFIMSDTMSDGLTFNNDVKVTINGVPAEKGTDYAVYVGGEGDDYTFQVALLDAKNHPGADVVVTYSATVNSKAVAMVPETNEYKVIYSNNPEEKYEGTNDDDKPGKPKKDSETVLGETPKKTTKTYVTKLDLIKTNTKGELLKGATFKLHSDNANQTVMATYDYYELDNENGTYYLLKDGTYTTEAPKDNRYVATGSKGDTNTTEGYILVGEEYVVPTDRKDYIGQDLYILMVGTESQYANTNKYTKKTAETTSSVSAPVDVTLTTDDAGKLCFDGLGTGTYTLTEVDAPDGYNYIEPVTFTIVFDAETETFNVVNVSGGATITGTNGILSTTVVDQSGTVLPETGGIGTTLFYVIGGILVVGAGILLITKRRMVNAQ